MKKSLKLLGIGLISLFVAGTVSADDPCGGGICTNMTFTPGTICLKPDDSYFANINAMVQYIIGDTRIEVCENPNLKIKTSIDACDNGDVEWYFDEALTQKVTGTTIGDVMKKVDVKTDANGCVTEYNYLTNLYAKCVEKEVKQCPTDIVVEKVLMYNNDNVITKVIVNNKQNLLTPTKDGYIFDGWYYDEKYTSKVEGSTTDSIEFVPVYDEENCIIDYKDVILYAKWTKIPDTCTDVVSTNANLTYIIDDTESKKVTISIVKDEELLVPSKEGYIFAGWYYDEEFTNEVSDLTFIQNFDENGCLVGYEDIVIYAKWEKKNETPKVDNPETGDNIILYVGVGVILLAGCIVVIKKLTNK